MPALHLVQLEPLASHVEIQSLFRFFFPVELFLYLSLPCCPINSFFGVQDAAKTTLAYGRVRVGAVGAEGIFTQWGIGQQCRSFRTTSVKGRERRSEAYMWQTLSLLLPNSEDLIPLIDLPQSCEM